MVKIESTGWYIFLIIAAGVILFFNWIFLKETKRIQEKMKGMKSFSDIIDATNQALDEFNTAFDEAGKLLEKRRKDMEGLIERAESSIRDLRGLAECKPVSTEQIRGVPFTPIENAAPPIPEEVGEVDKVDMIKKLLVQGKSHEEICRITGSSRREISFVEKLAAGK